MVSDHLVNEASELNLFYIAQMIFINHNGPYADIRPDIELGLWKAHMYKTSTREERLPTVRLIEHILRRWWEDGRAPNGANYGTSNERLREVATARLELALGLGLAG